LPYSPSQHHAIRPCVWKVQIPIPEITATDEQNVIYSQLRIAGSLGPSLRSKQRLVALDNNFRLREIRHGDSEIILPRSVSFAVPDMIQDEESPIGYPQRRRAAANPRV